VAIRITFNRRRPPTLRDVYAAVGEAVARVGRVQGIHLHLELGEVLGPDPTPWILRSWDPHPDPWEPDPEPWLPTEPPPDPWIPGPVPASSKE
jgi:hypothetical protein